MSEDPRRTAPLSADPGEIVVEDKTDFHSGETFWTYAEVRDRAVALEVAKWFCPRNYIVVYHYDKSTVHVRGTGKGGAQKVRSGIRPADDLTVRTGE